MHEMGIAQGILDAAVDAANDDGGRPITEIHVSVGELTMIVEFALRFAFDSLREGTLAEGAELVVNAVPARSRCDECGHEYTHDRFQMLCPACGSLAVTLLAGKELQIDYIETED